MTLAEALAGKDVPENVKNTLALISVPYFSFEREVRQGQLVVHTALADEVKRIFEELVRREFPIEKMEPIVAYGWDDDASMASNNTSAFNYRTIAGLDTLSNHARGRAIDINPMQNPYTQYDGKIVPLGAVYDVKVPGTITSDVASVFKSFGWDWGGEWKKRKDYQHFEKP